MLIVLYFLLALFIVFSVFTNPSSSLFKKQDYMLTDDSSSFRFTRSEMIVGIAGLLFMFISFLLFVLDVKANRSLLLDFLEVVQDDDVKDSDAAPASS